MNYHADNSIQHKPVYRQSETCTGDAGQRVKVTQFVYPDSNDNQHRCEPVHTALIRLLTWINRGKRQDIRLSVVTRMLQSDGATIKDIAIKHGVGCSTVSWVISRFKREFNGK